MSSIVTVKFWEYGFVGNSFLVRVRMGGTSVRTVPSQGHKRRAHECGKELALGNLKIACSLNCTELAAPGPVQSSGQRLAISNWEHLSLYTEDLGVLNGLHFQF